MKITIYQDAGGNPIVSVEDETNDIGSSPETVTMAYLEAQKLLKEAENK